MNDQLSPRPRPCASCPYRQGVPSGIWHPEEYAKLPRYDADTMDQPAEVFMCHQGSGDVCSGWLGHKTDPTDLLAVRLGLMTGRLHPGCADYTTTVPLFASGAEAAQHGCAQVHSPGARAQAAIDKITRVRARAGAPVTDTPRP